MKSLLPSQITEIIFALQSGQVLVLPSETSYGISCDATNTAAVEKIFSIKGRESGKPVLVVVDSITTAKRYLQWNEVVEKVAQKYWSPEEKQPLTVVGAYRKKFLVKKLARSVISSEKTLAVRATKHLLLKELCQKLGRPIVSTSANVAGAAPMYDPRQITQQFSKQAAVPDVIVDVGVLSPSPNSTIVSVVDGKLKVLRQGMLKV